MKAQKVSMRFDNIVRRSVNEYQIMLPYNYFATPNENDFRAFQGVAVESKVKPHDITDIAVYAIVQPSKTQIWCGFHVCICTAKGIAYRKTIRADANPEQACKLLKAYFREGAPGLDPDYCLLITHDFDEYRYEGDRQRCDIALSILESGGTAEDVIDTLEPYKGKVRIFY